MDVREGLKITIYPLLQMEELGTGDIPKAIVAGADSVMLGSLLAGTQESLEKLLFLRVENSKPTVEWDLLKQ